LSPALPLIAALTPEPFDDIQIIDGNSESVPFDEKFNLVGISMMTVQADEGYRIAQEYRKRGIHVVVGGVHPTLLPDEASKHADTVMIGEVEDTWPLFIKDFLNGCPKHVYQQGKIVNLTHSPIPRYDLLAMKYHDHMFIQTSRGCPHRCKYCSVSVVYGNHCRYKTVEQVTFEVEVVRQLNPSAQIIFSDDNMFANRKRGKDLLRALIPLQIKWVTQTDITIADDDELLDLISESGCVYVFIGFESITESGIAYLSDWKYQQLKTYSDKIRKIQSHGVRVCGAFIVGTDSDDETIFDRILQFAKKNHLDQINISILTPFPGTSIRKRLAKENRLLNKPWSNYNFFSVNHQPKLITPKKLQLGLLKTLILLHTEQ
jgi:radical SAM superfamily enzyme YgiQ (UPF0313 family)